MLEVKTLKSEMKNSFDKFMNKLDKSRGKKIYDLEARLMEINQTVIYKGEANKQLSKHKTKHQDAWGNDK